MLKHHALKPDEPPPGFPTAFTCPRCGGTIWEETLTEDTLAFRCRIGHELSLAGMLAEHGAVRRTKLVEAGRLLAEAAALNGRIASWARERGHSVVADRLDQEAAALTQRADEVMRIAASVLLDQTEV
jgi:hypothetical protein